MEVITPNVGAGLSGRIGMQVLESTLLPRVRCASARMHGVNKAFKARYGYSFDGSTESYLRCSPEQRRMIERDVVRHIQEHSHDWSNSELRTKYVQPTKPNLILDTALNGFFAGNRSIATLTKACALGTGTATPAVTDTLLGTEVKRSNTYLTTTGACGTTYGTSSYTTRRTYDFGVETSDQNYTEIGFSHNTSAKTELNIRSLLSGTATVLTGQQARAVHELTVNCNNTTRQSGTLGITGWPVAPATTTAAEWQWQALGLSTVSTEGNDRGAGFFEPALGKTLGWCLYTGVTLSSWLSNATTSGYLNGCGVDYYFGVCGWDTYITGSFQRTVVPSKAYPPNLVNSTSIRGFGFGTLEWFYPGYGFSDGNALCVRFNEAQTKDSLHSLKLVGFTFSLNRS